MIVVAAMVGAVLVPGVGRADPGASAALVTASKPVPRWAPPAVAGVPAPAPVGGLRPSILACDTHAVGSFGYRDKDGILRPSPNIEIQVRDQASGALIQNVTNAAGAFDLCFTAAQFTRLFITIKAENSQWRVQNGASIYNWSTPIRNNPVAGTTLNFGSMTPGSADDQRAAQAFDEGNDAWTFTPHGPACWDLKNLVCRQVIMDWSPAQPGENGRSVYSTATNTVLLINLAPTIPTVVTHEIGHAVMDMAYADAFPPDTNCAGEAGHDPNAVTNQNCAWVEGWADFFAATAERTQTDVGGNGVPFDVGRPAGPAGDAVEVNVAAALLDLVDFDSGEPWDEFGEGTSRVFSTLTHHIDQTFPQFWADRGADGFDVSDNALGPLYQSNIDYDFHRPLFPGVADQLPPPAKPFQRFTMTTAANSWSAVAVRPLVFSATQDDDLNLYSDRAEQKFIVGSDQDANRPEFIAVDSNAGHLPPTTYYPTVHRAAGTEGPYDIEYAPGGTSLAAGTSSTFQFTGREFVKVVNVPGTPGTPITVTLTPASSTSNADIYFFGDEVSNKGFVTPTTGFRVGHANGAAATVSLTATANANYAVVVIATNELTGNYTLTRS